MTSISADPTITTPLAKKDWSRVVFFIGSFLFVVRLLGSGWRQGFPIAFPDSANYLSTSALGPFSSEFWLGDKPVGLPLMLWLLRSNIRAFIVFQTVVYISAGLFLFRTILETFAHRISAWLGIFISAGILSHYKFALWNLEVLSESLILSLTIIGISLVIRISQNPTKSNLILFCTVLSFLVLLRDINVVLAILAICGAGIVLRTQYFKEHQRLIIRLAVVLSIFSLYVLIAQSESQRYQYGVINNVGIRILPDPRVSVKTFDENPQLLQLIEGRAGRNAWDDGGAFLTDPSLEPFRNWVYKNGQKELFTSMITEPAFWNSHISNGMSSTLAQDLRSYDRFGTSLRLNIFPLNEVMPSSSGNYLIVVALSSLAFVFIYRRRQHKQVAIASIILLTISSFFFVVSIAADAVEVERHSIPPLLMTTIPLVLCIVALVDRAISSLPLHINSFDRVQASRSTDIAVSGFFVLTMMSIVALEFRTQDWDPSFARTIIERIDRFGGTYYQNGIWHHGPIDALLYDIPRFFTTYGTYWFGIALLVIAMSGLVALSITRIAKFFEIQNSIVLALAIAVFLHLSISSSDYAGVIYSRNTTTTMLVCTFAFGLTRRPWKSPRLANRSLIIACATLGLAVQTMVSSIITAVVVGAFVYLLHRQEISLRRPIIYSVLSFAISVATAPMWYLMRGSFGEFWANWWVMARHMNSATNRNLLNQFSLGWDKFYEYYTQRPELALIVGIFITLLIKNWTSMTEAKKITNGAVLLWFVAAWVELIISQRYSSHYFVIPTIPTSIMLVIVASSFFPAVPRKDEGLLRNASVIPAILTAIVLIFYQCSDLFWSGAEGLSRFQSFRQHQQFVSDTRSGESKTVRAVLDLATSDNDAVLAWTMFPWTYLEHQRVPATRLSWKSFMLGEIYLASTSEKYILPETWKWFADDMKQSQPNAYLHPKEIAFVDSTPFASYASENFDLAMETDKHRISLRKELWAQMISPLEPGVEEENQKRTDSEGSPVPLISHRCTRSDITIIRESSDAKYSVDLNFEQNSHQAPQSVIRIDTNKIQVLANGYTQYSQALPSPFNEELTLSILLGTRSAAVVINGQIASAIRLQNPTGVSMSSTHGATSVDRVATSPAPYLNQCSSASNQQ